MSETVQNPRIRGAMLPSFIAAGSSSVVLMTAVAPIERIKLLLQNQDVSTQISRDERYKSATDCLKRIIREQGFFSLWRGYFITVVRYTFYKHIDNLFADSN